ncbi:DgyrCDS2413 [Dimorphilus gyrociliatus]|uniref:glycerophosphocholine cholinephosphodiesterase n=1 Tax=Dimorphilus gyrociliatus TaxID=2664684 RepID=A0A7I8VFC7_9ANNE|nr:DgyrCDS2413 [Dimorphilus gyrociliatus]
MVTTTLSALILLTLMPVIQCRQKLIVILIDGIRYNYETDSLKGFRSIVDSGVKSDFMRPAFPTTSSTNYYSIATGLNPESHGILGNEVWDEERKEIFKYNQIDESHDAKSKSYWFNGGEPIWITAEKQGLKSRMYYWIGCDIEIRGKNTTFCEKYPMKPLTRSQFNYAWTNGIEAIANRSADFIGIHEDRVYSMGLKHGPDSIERKNALRDVSEELDSLMKILKYKNLTDVNVMIVSDHGMTKVNNSRVIRLNTSEENYKLILRNGAVVNLWPKKNKTEECYKELKDSRIDIFLKRDIPDRWRYKNNKRVSPLLVVARKGYSIILVGIKKKDTLSKNRGADSYDNDFEDMRTYFAATGPAFRKKQILPHFPNVDLYNVMCSILDINPSPNNGTATFDGLVSTNQGHALANLRSILNRLRIRRYKSIPEYNLETNFDDEDTLFFNDIK